MTASRQRAASFALAACGIWFLLAVAYAWRTGSDFVSRDQWHFLPVVDHYLSGQFDWRELWQSHSEHVKPGYKLLFIWNARYLGLDLQLEIMTGMALLGFATLLLVREMRRPAEGDAALPVLAWSAAAVIMLSFNQWANFGYGLLALGGFGGTLILLGLFIGFSRLLLRGLTPAALAGWVLLLALGIFGFSGARSPAVVGSCLLAALLAWLLDPSARARILRYALPLLALGAAGIGVYLGLLQLPPGRHMALLDELRFIAGDPVGAATYISGILAESMLDLTDVRRSLHVQAEVWGLALLGYGMLAWCLWRYFRARLWLRSWVPFMLIAYSAAFTLEILVGRYGSGNGVLQGSMVPRYVFDSHLWMVGCAWILGLDWALSGTPRLKHVATALLALLVALEVGNLYSVERMAASQARAVAGAQAKLRAVAAGTQAAEDLPAWACPSPPLCQQGVATLVKYHLDIARANAQR